MWWMDGILLGNIFGHIPIIMRLSQDSASVAFSLFSDASCAQIDARSLQIYNVIYCVFFPSGRGKCNTVRKGLSRVAISHFEMIISAGGAFYNLLFLIGLTKSSGEISAFIRASVVLEITSRHIHVILS